MMPGIFTIAAGVLVIFWGIALLLLPIFVWIIKNHTRDAVLVLKEIKALLQKADEISTRNALIDEKFGAPCPTCGTNTIKVRESGMTAFYCPFCKVNVG